MNDNLKVTRTRVNKDGKQYQDINLVWNYNDKEYVVRIAPRFRKDFALLLAIAETLPTISK